MSTEHLTALRERFVGDIDDEFRVPAYQRGYRWGAHEVQQLLDDIWESEGAPYHLQPVVVKALPSGMWELIDGQQRLTTIFLIFAYMHRESLQSTPPRFLLDYETRPEMQSYLDNPAAIPADANIDAFHLAAAYRTIAEWFEQHGGRRQYVANKLYGYFFESVRVIWYEAPPDIDTVTVFTRLNVGRIPLTDAELVKALLLSRAETVTTTRGRAHEIAAQWDAIERDLRDPELWAFITGGMRDDATHISLLFDVLAGGPTGHDRPLFYTFETLRPMIEADTIDTWNRVLDLHSLVVGWFEDRDVFHRVGFLVATGDTLDVIVDLSRETTKSDFDSKLIERISSRLALSNDDVGSLGYEYRRGKPAELALLLMNVETARRSSSSSERFSFDAYVVGRWSLEHIHAQSAKSLTRQEQWVEWLRLHRGAIADAIPIGHPERAPLLFDIGSALAQPRLAVETFRRLEDAVVKRLGDASDIDVHAITNLALLDSGSNSALSNSVFEVKRREILRRDMDGNYIPACTRNVFLKYYTNASAQQLHFWGPDDREGYLRAILDALGPYLRATGESTIGDEDE